MRIKILIEYFGKNYCGWQRQLNLSSVQQVLEDALSVVLRHSVTLWGSGRTDSGVHALGQAAHFDTDNSIPPGKILASVNTLLPFDIRVVDAEYVSDDFHAQYSAKSKVYLYKSYISRIQKPLKVGYAVRVIPPLDIEKMKDAAKLLIGMHDFKAFSSVHNGTKTTLREIYSIDIILSNEDLTFRIEGNGFLMNMVRIIVGTLIFIGKGKIPIENISEMLNSGNRNLGGKTFSAEGLYLEEVKYF